MADTHRNHTPREASERYSIGLARERDLAAIASIELAAARLLAEHAPPAVLTETTSLQDLARARRLGRLWIARLGEVPVGFAHVVVREPTVAHLEEIDVHPAHGRRGLGTRLAVAVCEWAGAAGFASVTLTTFRHVPWNMPFYSRLGFDVIPHHVLGPALLALVDDEARRGLDPSRRVVMRKYVGARPAIPGAKTPG